MSQPDIPSLDALAAAEIDDVDVRALRRTATLFDTLDPVPPGLVDRINFGLTLDALHAEIAELQRSADLVGMRSAGAEDVQSVTFTSATLSTMVTITPGSADRVRIDGWIAPGGGVTVELRTGAGTRRTAADSDGRFVLDDVPRGLAQFVLRLPDSAGGKIVITPSIEL